MVVLSAMPTQTRQLAAIMFTDIVGYTALMGKNSAKALELVRVSKEIQKPLVENYNGKWLKEMGDGAMAQFGSALDAVNCALEIQRTSRADFEGDLRIGIHLGDITLEENDVYGDGVNVAARLESISDPGGIYISESIEKAIRGQSDIQAKYLGVVLLKNVDYGVRTYAIQGDSLPVPSKRKIKELSGSQTKWERLFKSAFAYFFVICLLIAAGWWIWQNSKADELHEIRSLAILPFDDLSGNKDQEYLVDGLQDNLITTISKMSSIRITSRTSTKQYKNTDMSVPEIAKELGVDAIIEASLLKFEAVVQLNVQLVKAFPEEQHLWQDIFERPAGDILYLFDDVAQTISNEVSSALSENNPSMSSTAKEINPEAYKAYMNGKFLAENAPTNETLERALKYFQRSIELDSTYAPAYAGISWVWISLHQMHSVPGAEAIPKIYAYNSKAIELDPDYADAQYHKAVISFQDEWNWGKSEKAFLKAFELNPNHSMAHAHYSHLLMYLQRFEEAIPHMEMAIKLDPLSPHVLGLCAIVYWHMGDFEKALNITKKNSDIFGKSIIEESYAYSKGDFESSMKILEMMFGADSLMFITVRKEYNDIGYKAAMKKLAENLENNDYRTTAVIIALLYNRADMVDDAVRVLEQGYKNHDPNMPYAFIPIEFKNLELDPRYIELAKKMNLPV